MVLYASWRFYTFKKVIEFSRSIFKGNFNKSAGRCNFVESEKSDKGPTNMNPNPCHRSNSGYLTFKNTN